MSNEKSYIYTYRLQNELATGRDIFEREDFRTDVFKYAVKNAISDFGSYWQSEDAQKIIRDDTLGYIWNSYPDYRESLLSIIISQASSSGYSSRIRSLTKEFSAVFLENLYKQVPADDKSSTNKLRVRLVSVLRPGFDYLSELNKFSLIEQDREVFNMWESAALSSSTDENLFDYLWSRVKREKGATDKKESIISSAIKVKALSDSLVARVAKSSPKRLKRVVVSGISEDMRNLNRSLRLVERQPSDYSPSDVADIKEKLAKLEKRAMLFVGCTDYTVVESLIDCLSRDNLPWLMPAVSGHHWLGQRLNRLLEKEEA